MAAPKRERSLTERARVEARRKREEATRRRLAGRLLARRLIQRLAIAGAPQALVSVPGGQGGGQGGGVDVDDLASKREIQTLRTDLSRIRKQASAKRGPRTRT